MTITVLAIDGQGNNTLQYLDLLQDTANIFPAEEIKLLTSDINARHGIIECIYIPKLDYLGYSQFCIEQLTKYINTDFFLNVQLDGFILNPELWDNDFLKYDYIGAPWQNKKSRPLHTNMIVGNGGFSIRSKRLLNTLEKIKWHSDWEKHDVLKEHWGNEDYFICVLIRDILEAQGIKFAPIDLASRFSVQSGDPLGRTKILKNVFGFHGTGLVGKARRHVEKQGIYYNHLKNIKKSIFPLRY